MSITLFDYQQEGVDFLLSHCGGLLADEQGLGKTIQALTSCRDDEYILIICPAIMRETWKAEVNTVLGRTASVVKKSSDIKDNCIICSYDYISVHVKDIIKFISDKTSVILDESHYIKTPSSKRTKAVMWLLQYRLSKKILLTGTPITRDIDDLYIPLRLFIGDTPTLKNLWSFRKSYMKCVHSFFGDKFTGYKDENSKNAIKDMLSKFCLRRVKSSVLKDLPIITRQKIIVDTTKAVAKESLKLLDLATAVINHDYASYATYSRELEDKGIHVATIRRALGVAKAPKILEFIKYLFETHNKIVLFCVHTEVIDLLSASCREHYKDEVKISKIYGATSDKSKQDTIREFQQNDDKKHLIISNIVAGGVGITLTKSNVVVFGEIDWTPANIMQAEARVHRLTQEKNVLSYFVVCKDSIDDRILSILNTKMGIIKAII